MYASDARGSCFARALAPWKHSSWRCCQAAQRSCWVRIWLVIWPVSFWCISAHGRWNDELRERVEEGVEVVDEGDE